MDGTRHSRLKIPGTVQRCVFEGDDLVDLICLLLEDQNDLSSRCGRIFRVRMARWPAWKSIQKLTEQKRTSMAMVPVQ
jgi:hypothetical protein